MKKFRIVAHFTDFTAEFEAENDFDAREQMMQKLIDDVAEYVTLDSEEIIEVDSTLEEGEE